MYNHLILVKIRTWDRHSNISTIQLCFREQQLDEAIMFSLHRRHTPCTPYTVAAFVTLTVDRRRIQ